LNNEKLELIGLEYNVLDQKHDSGMTFEGNMKDQELVKKEHCCCEQVSSVKIMYAYEESSIYCMNCNLQVIRDDFEEIQNLQEFSTWKNEYNAIYKLWLVSGSYETWANEQLALPDSILNKDGRELTKVVGKILKCYYFIHQDNSEDQTQELEDCPVCGEKMKNAEVRNFLEKYCDECSIVV